MKKYFYILTIQWSAGGVPNSGTCTGVADVHEGESQETLFQALFRSACEKFGAPKAASSVISYYLARNDL